MMTCDTCAVNHVVRNPGGFHLCILKAIKIWWEGLEEAKQSPNQDKTGCHGNCGQRLQWVVCTKCVQGGHMSLCGQDRTDLGCSCGPMYICFRYCYCRQLTVR